MTKAERIKQTTLRLEFWAQRITAINTQYAALSAITGPGVGSPLWDAIFSTQNAYTVAVSELVGDECEWLNYYQLDCEMGKRPREVKLPSGNAITLKTLRDLARVICD